MSVSFDTLKFARALRDKANMPAEQAEGVAEAFGIATAEQLATKSDLDILKTELRAEIGLLKWMIGFALALLIAVFGKLFLH